MILASDPEASARRRDLQRELVRRCVGKKVIVSTTDLHYLVGRLESFDDQDQLHLTVNGRPVLLQRSGLARIQEADVAQAEYLK